MRLFSSREVVPPRISPLPLLPSHLTVPIFGIVAHSRSDVIFYFSSIQRSLFVLSSRSSLLRQQLLQLSSTAEVFLKFQIQTSTVSLLKPPALSYWHSDSLSVMGTSNSPLFHIPKCTGTGVVDCWYDLPPRLVVIF